MIAQVIIVQIQEVLNWGFAGVLSLVLLIATLAVYYVYGRTVGVTQLIGGAPSTSLPSAGFASWRSRVERSILGAVGTAITAACNVTGLSRRSAKASRRRLAAVVGLLLAFMSLPSLFIIPVSFTRSTFLGFPPEGVSWRWYEELLTSPIWLSAAARSFVVAILTAGLSLVLGISCSFVLTRRTFSGQKAVVGLVLAPMILPRIAIGVAMFYLFVHLDLVGTTLGLVIGHTVLALPYVVIALAANLIVYDQRLDEAAWVLGANMWRTLIHVTLPIMRGGIIAATIFAFMTSLDDLSVALFITGGEQATLPKQMWNSMTLQATPILASVSTLILIVMTGCAVGADVLSRRKR
jgi:putative spermidine/putrescine transport system permease protein